MPITDSVKSLHDKNKQRLNTREGDKVQRKVVKSCCV